MNWLKSRNLRSALIPGICTFLIGIAVWSIHETRTQVVSAQSSPRPFHVPATAIPGFSLTAPTPIEGTSLSSGTYTVNNLLLDNTDTTTHNITVSDCGTPTFKLSFVAIAPPGTSMVNPILVNMPGTIFVGCVKWQSDSTKVLGQIYGTR